MHDHEDFHPLGRVKVFANNKIFGVSPGGQ
jgi:hypothetical protein